MKSQKIKNNARMARPFDYSRWTGGPDLYPRTGGYKPPQAGVPNFDDMCGGRVSNRTVPMRAMLVASGCKFDYEAVLTIAQAEAVQVSSNDRLGLARYLFADASALVFRLAEADFWAVDAQDTKSIRSHCARVLGNLDEVRYFQEAIKVLELPT